MEQKVIIAQNKSIIIEENKTVEEEIVDFNYFHQSFIQKLYIKKVELLKTRLGREADDLDIIDLLYFEELSKEEQLLIANSAILEICQNYLLLSGTKLETSSRDPFEFVSLILDHMEENPYKYSFLMSIQFIYKDYFSYLGIGSPVLKSGTDEKLMSCFKVQLNYLHELDEFEAINMDLLEQGKIMTQILSMESKGKVGPIPKVLMLSSPPPNLKVIVQ